MSYLTCIGEIRRKYASANNCVNLSSPKTTVGMILDGCTAVFVVPGSPAFKPLSGSEKIRIPVTLKKVLRVSHIDEIWK